MLRRTTAILATTAAISLAIVAPARADVPPLKDYAAGATATALQLTLLGQELAVSQTQAAVSSAPKAAADGAALLLAGNPLPGAAPSNAPEGPASNEQCPIQADLDEITQGALSALQLEVACFSTSATTDGGPAAQAGSGEVTIRVLAPGGTLLEPILGPVLEGVTQVTDPLVVALAPLLGAIDDATQIDVADVLDQLTTAVGTDLFVLAEIVVAPAVSQASANATDGVVANAGSNGVTINILPGIASTLAQLTNLIDVPNPSNGPLLSVKLGAANAKVVRDPKTGVAAPDASAAQLLSITADDSLGLLQGLADTVSGALDALSIAELSCDGGALADVLCIDLGAVNELDSAELTARNMNFGEGTVGREASAATVRVLPIAAAALGGDVLGLSLASATAAANAHPADDIIRQAPPESPNGALPRTGGDTALPLTLALLGLGAAGAAIVRRTRTA
jgi:hypothetical protein